MRSPAQSHFARCAIVTIHAALAGLVIAFYVWTSISGRPSDFSPNNKGYYGRLSEAFLAGRTYFEERPPEELKTLKDPYDPAQRNPRIEGSAAYLHDASYYNGKYYIYFGPVPSLVLGAPFKLITGLDFNEYLLPAVFCALTYLAGMLIIVRLRRALAPNASNLAVFAACLAYGLCGTQLFMLRRPSVYEASIAAGVFFTLAAILTLLPVVLSVTTFRKKLAGLVLGSVFLALAVGSRQSYLLSIPPVALLLWVALGEKRRPAQGKPGRFAMAAAFVLPGAALIGCLLIYNYVRFDSPFSTGHEYQLTSLKADSYEFLSPRFVPANLYLNLFFPLRLEADFPYFQAQTEPPEWLRPPAGYIGDEKIMGALTNIPILLLLIFGVALLLTKRLSLARPGSAALGLLAVPGVVNMSLVMAYSHATLRYLFDFIPFFLLCTAIFFLMMASRYRFTTRALSWLYALAAPLALYSILTNASIGLTGYLGDFEGNNPREYCAIKQKVTGLVSLFSPGEATR
ncbi:MAG: hypothetical protein HQK81_03615 [Desulfovibrionaceae bacterium]|nr:hypothetical protein [Desulfovibrionaceae bacterium]MBF0513130.1 hypothetical protein [Desulfovibrionaceae bacterium]